MIHYPSTTECTTCAQEMTYWHGDYYCVPCEEAWAVEMTDAERASETPDFLAWNQPPDDGDTGSTFDADNAHHVILVSWHEMGIFPDAGIVAFPIEADHLAAVLVDSLYTNRYAPTCLYLNRTQTVALVESLTATLTDTTF